MRGATDNNGKMRAMICISIHAPHAGRDIHYPIVVYPDKSISIHAPHAGRDPQSIPAETS